jgi:hypothetical protein
MSTHALGTGTRNLSINIPVDERDELGRLGFQAVEQGAARSIGDWLRSVLLAGLEHENPKAAAKVRQIRRQYYGTAALLAVLAWGSWQAAQPGNRMEPLRRATTRISMTLRVVRRGREEQEVVAL